MLKRVVIILILIMFPFSLFFANSFANFIHYALPAVLILILCFLFLKKYKYYFIPIFVIPFVEPKFALLPVLFFLLNFSRKNLIFMTIAIFLFVFLIKPFYGQLVLTRDFQGEAMLVEKGNLYHSVLLARIFQNKPGFYFNGFISNLFENLDPNNYFFGFSPRQIKVDDQNLVKFPFLSLPFFLIGLYYMNKNKNIKFILTILIAIIINLALLTNYDRNDFIYWIPISLVILYGLNIFDREFKYRRCYYILFIAISLIETLRTFVK